MVKSAVRDLVERLHMLVGNDTQAIAAVDSGVSLAWPSPKLERDFEPDWSALALKEYRLRRQRTQLFGAAELFGEPSWDIMLDIFAHQMKGDRISITSACTGACVPQTTALRWLTILERHKLLARIDDASDGRRSFVQLTRRGLTAMKRHLASAQSATR